MKGASGRANDYLGAPQPVSSTLMCSVCVVTLGSFVGAVAVAKAGGLAGAKMALVAFATTYLIRRR
jgi:hypothetical protein